MATRGQENTENLGKRNPLFFPLIHSFSAAYLGFSDRKLSMAAQLFFSPTTSSRSIGRIRSILMSDGKCNRSSMFWVSPEVSSQMDMPGKTSKGKCPGGLLIRCPNHLTWLFSSQRSSGSTQSSLLMSEFLTISLHNYHQIIS